MPEPITQEDVALIRASPWFQEEWYLERYPDVREAALDPARHYLEFGAAEARNPVRTSTARVTFAAIWMCNAPG